MKALCVSLVILITLSFSASAQVTDTCRLGIGTNISGPSDWSAQWPFVNIMKFSRSWGTTNISWVSGGQNMWDTGLIDSIPLDDQGYPLSMPVNINHPNVDTSQVAFTVWTNTAALVEGQYVVLYDGIGELAFWGDATIASQEPGRVVIDVVSGVTHFIRMKIISSQLGAHVRNIRVLLPGTESSYQTEPFHNQWIEKLKPFKSIRFMDWGRTNNSVLSNWNDRPVLDDYTYTINGVPYEWWIELANEMQMDIWICVPHLANDTYITNMAEMFRDELDPNLKIYVEYTNEWWNWMFTQAHYVDDSLNQDLPWPERYAPKLADVMQIWTDVFEGQQNRIVRVFASQHGYWDLSWRVLEQLEIDNQMSLIDAVSPAAYMTTDTDSLAILGSNATGEDVIRMAYRVTFDPDGYHILGWNEHAIMAEEYNLILLFYEGGQHFTPDPFGTVQPYGPALVEAQTHPGIYDLYDQLLDTLRGLTDQEMEFMNFSFISGTSEKYGSWGVLENQFTQFPPYLYIAPKYQVLLDVIYNCDTITNTEDIEDSDQTISIFPNPNNGNFTIRTTFNQAYDLLIIDQTGRLVYRNKLHQLSSQINTNLVPGLYMLCVTIDESMYQIKFIVSGS